MPDSVDTLDVDKNKGDIESVIQTWLNNNSGVTSVDLIEQVDVGPNRAVVIILYTA